MKTVALLIVNYNGLAYLPQCLSAVFTTLQPDIERLVYVVDNNSTDTSVDYIRQHYPQVRLIQAKTNLGFAGGNQLGWEAIIKQGQADYIFLLNQDAYLTDRVLTQLVDFLEQHSDAAAVQPKLLLWPDQSLINSLGNRIHYLGFGYTEGNGWPDQQIAVAPRSINYCTGAAVLLRPEVIEQLGSGLFDPEMFMYHEDLDLGWRLRLAGYRNYLVPSAVVYHQYEFQRSLRQIFYFERNRLWVGAKNYRLGTLVLLFPAWLVMELGQLFFAWKRQWLKAKLKSYSWLFSGSQWGKLWRQRRQLGRQRKVSDRVMLQEFTGQILFQPLAPWLLRYVANPVFAWYRRLVLLIIYW
ncbi:MAG: glycosyltransferase family 2 protein [Candidatus Komeilibacteria bacterium]